MTDADAILSKDVISLLQRWRLDAEALEMPLTLYLGVDVGGTNTRVAVINEYERICALKNPGPDQPKSGAFLALAKFKSSTLTALIEKLRTVGQQLVQATKKKPVSAVVSVAGPVTENGQKVNLTNYIGERDLGVRQLPSILFNHESTRFINDLAASCQGINSLGEEGRVGRYFGQLWSDVPIPENLSLNPTNYLVLSMGTGLGCGVLAILPNGIHEVIALETGHISVTNLSHKHSDSIEEIQLYNWLSERIYKGRHTIEYEDICSGRGLSACYQFVVRNIPHADKTLTPETIAKRAGDDPNAHKAMFLHYKYLFRVAKELCIGLNCKAFFLTGDNQIYNDKFVKDNADLYHKEFLDHPKVEWINEAICYRQTRRTELNLRGALYSARRLSMLADTEREVQKVEKKKQLMKMPHPAWSLPPLALGAVLCYAALKYFKKLQ